MTALARGVSLLEAALAAASLAGILARGKQRTCWAFTLYLASIVIFEGSIGLWPHRFFTWSFWLVKETAHATLKLAIALELTRRIFRPFPFVRGLAGVGLLGLLVLVAVAVAAGQRPEATVFAHLLARVLYGTACALVLILVAALWFHIPLDPLHKAILLGFVPYLLLFTVVVQTLESFGWQLRELVNYWNWAGFIALLCYWVRAAWVRSPVVGVAPEVVERLQPWAVHGGASR
jgi:hypothetical protein